MCLSHSLPLFLEVGASGILQRACVVRPTPQPQGLRSHSCDSATRLRRSWARSRRSNPSDCDWPDDYLYTESTQSSKDELHPEIAALCLRWRPRCDGQAALTTQHSTHHHTAKHPNDIVLHAHLLRTVEQAPIGGCMKVLGQRSGCKLSGHLSTRSAPCGRAADGKTM